MNTILSRTPRALSAALFLSAFLAALLAASPVAAQDKNDGAEKNGEDDASKTIAELTEGAERIEGLFTLFRNPDNGETHMLIRGDQLGAEYIYWMQVADGVVDAGFFRGLYGPNGIIEMQRNFDTIEIVQKNTAFYFDPDNAISRASEANISHALLAVEEIAAEDGETGDVLIKADGVFASDALVQIKPTPRPWRRKTWPARSWTTRRSTSRPRGSSRPCITRSHPAPTTTGSSSTATPRP